MRLAFVLPALAMLAGCPTRDVSELDIHPSNVQKKDIPVSTNRNVDILFVIDNSSSMKDKQDNLVANFPAFANVLENIQGGLPNIHLGVVSSNVGVGGYNVGGCSGSGDNGALQNSPRISGCTPPTSNSDSPNGRFISDIDVGGTRQKNYTGNLGDTFSCIAALGTSGCGFEHHFEGMKRALDGSNASNTGFLRDNAYLAVIIIGDEDDCSARDDSVFDPNKVYDTLTSKYGPFDSFRCTEFGVSCDGGDISRSPANYTTCKPRGDSYFWDSSHYVDFLKSLKKDPNSIFVAIIGGNVSPFSVGIDPTSLISGAPLLEQSCSFLDVGGQNAIGVPGIRFKALTDAFGAHGTFESVCQSDYTDSLTNIAKALAEVIGNPCIEGDIDVTDIDANAPGLQLQCDVEDVTDPDTAQEVQTVIPRCPMDPSNPTMPASGAPNPCWYANIDTTNCPVATYPSGVVLGVVQDQSSLPAGTHVVASCVAK